MTNPVGWRRRRSLRSSSADCETYLLMMSAGGLMQSTRRDRTGSTFLTLNARSIFNKLNEIQLLSARYKPLFIAVQETWCLPVENDNLYHMPNYSIYRRDRPDGRSGGGVMIYTRNDAFSNVSRLTDSESIYEDLWLKLRLKTMSGGSEFLLCCSYRPPDCPVHQFAAALEKSIEKAKQMSSPIILCGDLNARCHEWCTSDRTDKAGEQFMQLFAAYDLRQMVSFPTHIHGGHLNACLDIIATDFPGDVTVTGLGPVGQSDHLTLLASISTFPSPPSTQTPATRSVWCWARTDVDALLNGLENADWPVLDEDSMLDSSFNINDVWQRWKTVLLDVADQHVPKTPLRWTSPPKPWVTRDFTQAVRRKHALFRRYQHQRTQVRWQEYCKQRNRVSALSRQLKSDFLLKSTNQTETASTSGPPDVSDHPQPATSHSAPRLYQLLRCLLKNKSAFFPDMLSADGNLVTTDLGKADLINTYFIKIISQSAGGGEIPPISIPIVEESENILSAFSLPDSFVLKTLRALDTRKAPGGDGIPTRLLKLGAVPISWSLHNVFNASFRTGTLPTEWKEATITPLFKQRGSRQEPGNYRPISLLSTVSKVLETCVAQQLAKHVEKYIPITQSGFRRNDSTELQLARLIHRLSKSLDDGHVPISCYLDLSKAFDRVWHVGLLKKLHHLGVRDMALAWLTDYLSGRRQRVRVESATSTWQPVTAGVPQGSVLGPLLFLIYTCDLPSAIAIPGCNVVSDQFADDTAICSVADQCTAAETNLQQATEQAAHWFRDWHLDINATKTVVMATFRRPLPLTYQIELDGVRLQRVTSHKHLGIYISSSLRWDAHVDYVLSRAAPLLGVLRKLRSSLNKNALCAFYLVYIRPVIEYASTAWSDLPVRLSDRLERLQRRAAKIILRLPLFQSSNHDWVLDTIGWPTLQSRRRYRLAVLGYRIANNIVPPHIREAATVFTRRDHCHDTRRKAYFNVPQSNTNLYKGSPLYSAVTAFNDVPEAIRTKPSLALFKAAAKETILTKKCGCSQHLRTVT